MRYLIAATMLVGNSPAESHVPVAARAGLDRIITRLEEAKKPGDYAVADYLADLDAIGKLLAAEPAAAREVAAAGVGSDFREEFARMALGLQRPGGAEKLQQPRIFYGCYEYQIPRDYLFKFFADRNIEQFYNPPTEAGIVDMHGGPGIYHFVKETATAEDLEAWEAWLMSPPSRERNLMRFRIGQALFVIHDPRCISLAIETYRLDGEKSAGQPERRRRDRVSDLTNLIGKMPGKEALEGLLKCHRTALALGFAGSGPGSTTEQVVSLISSRSAYAELFLNEGFLQSAKERGIEYEKDPAKMIANDNWKIYKPLVEAKLKATDKDTPPEDIEVLKQALEAMPKE